MRAGELRHRVLIQKATEARDAVGEVTKTWAAWQKRWAAVEPLSGGESVRGQQLVATMSHRIRLRYVEELNPTDYRIVFNDRVFDINAVVNVDERNRETQCMCSESKT